MLRILKLNLLFFLTAVFFTWNVEVVILLLNHSVRIEPAQLPAMFFNLFLYYGPLWFILVGLAFFIVQFFAEKKYPIGLFSPPSFTYFFIFTIFVLTWIVFLNYNYYYDFFLPQARDKFNKILLLNVTLIVIGTLFLFLKKKTKNWVQLLFTSVLALSIVVSANLVHPGQDSANPHARPDKPVASPRKLKIVLMDGLSLNFILNLSTKQKLLNFDWIRQNGVVGRIQTFSPNFDLSLLSTLLTGLPPYAYRPNSNNRFQLRDSSAEFDIFPRYILFRNSARLGLAYFYKSAEYKPLDDIKVHYEANGNECFSMITPARYPIYSQKNLAKDSAFVQFFPDSGGKKNRKTEILKKTFFLDNYLVHRIPNFKINDYRYFIFSLPGLDTITSHFYHYAHPQDFRNISTEQIQEYGTLLEKYYLYYDSIIGKLITTMGDEEMLIIISTYEAEPLPLWRRILLNYIDKKDIFVYKPNSSPGLILFYEKKALKKQFFLNSVSMYDIYPTLLYYAGFSLPKNLKGEVLRDIFAERFILNNLIPISSTGNRP